MKNTIYDLSEERAVTPVIGIVLTVAIVVIVATTISAVAFGEVSGISSPASQVSFAFNTDDATGDAHPSQRRRA